MSTEYSPTAMTPFYPTEEPNQPISLYEGPIELVQGNITDRGDGVVRFNWLPSPHLKFYFQKDSHSTQLRLDGSTEMPSTILRLPLRGATAKSSLVSISREFMSTNILKIEGEPINSITIGSSPEIVNLVFHIPNFLSFGREIIMEAGGWAVKLKPVDNFRNLIGLLRSTGGFAITHVGCLQRSNTTPFPIVEGQEVLKLLFWFLSFVKGTDTSPLLSVGLDYGGRQVWEEWYLPRLSSWRENDNWFIESEPERLTELFPGFLRRWQDSVWRELITLVVDWYVQANTSSPDRALVLAHTALELLGWVILVEENQILTPQGYKALWVSDVFRLLLSQFGISLIIPSTQKKLAGSTKAENWKDACHALSEIRNRIVHPKITHSGTSSNILRYPIPVRFEAAQLAIWFIERILLNLFSYSGPQDNNRLERYAIDE